MDKLTAENVSTFFPNITPKICTSPAYDFAWDVSLKGKFIGELFHSSEFKEWSFIKDNFPSPRQSFNVTFPITTEIFINLFKTIKINLIPN